MARLLDEWAVDAGPLSPGAFATFGLSDDERKQPLVVSAATYASFAFSHERGNGSNFGPFVAVLGEAKEHLDYIRDNHPEALRAWHNLSRLVSHPLVAATLNDLLWLLKYNHIEDPHTYAVAAIYRYLEAFDLYSSDDIEHRSLHLHDIAVRTASLARQLNAQYEHFAAIQERCATWLQNDATNSSYWALQAASNLGPHYKPENFDQRIDELHTQYSSSPNAEERTRSESLFAIQLNLATDHAERADIKRAAAAMFLEEAKQEASALKAHHYVLKAEEWARGAQSDADFNHQLLVTRNQLDFDQDLRSIETSVSIPTDELEAVRRAILDAGDHTSALKRIASFGAQVFFDLDAVENTVRELKKQSPLRDLVGITHVSEGGFVCCNPTSVEDRLKRDLAAEHRSVVQFWTKIAIEYVLFAVQEKFSMSEGTIVRHLLEGGIIEPDDADSFANAFSHYWNQEYDAAAHLALPRVESTLRKLSERMGNIITYRPRQGGCAGYMGLGRVLDSLEDSLRCTSTQALRHLLIDPHGMNLRNKYAHGIRSDDPKRDAALVLWIVLWLALLRSDSGKGDKGDV